MEIENTVVLAHRSAAERNRIARSFEGERKKIARRFRRKGIGLIVDHGGREQTSLIWQTASKSV